VAVEQDFPQRSVWLTGLWPDGVRAPDAAEGGSVVHLCVHLTGQRTAGQSPAHLLRSTADYLQVHGWHQGDLYDLSVADAHPPACVLGGIYHAAVDIRERGCKGVCCPSPDVPATFRALASYLVDTGRVERNQYPLPGNEDGVIGNWNDELDRTVTDILTALREAADRWERSRAS
jgi:hypothetical protein